MIEPFATLRLSTKELSLIETALFFLEKEQKTYTNEVEDLLNIIQKALYDD